MHILFYILLIGKSHIDFTDSLINVLVDNGHTVDLIVAKLNSHVTTNGTDRVERKFVYGFEAESPWNNLPHLLNPFEERKRTWMEHTHYMEVVMELCEIGLSNPALHEFIKSQNYDIGISTEYDSCGFALMKNYSIPSIVSVSSLGLMDQQSISQGLPNSASVTHAMFETEDLTTYFGRFKNLINWAHINLIIRPYCRQREKEVIGKYFGPKIAAIDFSEEIDLHFVNSNELIEIPRIVSHKFKYIGGINQKKPTGRLDPEIEKMISGKPGKNGIVLFCFGTQVPSNLFPIEVRRSFAQAFRHFPDFQFIWKYELQEGDEHIFANTTNVNFLKWVPQTELLNDPRIRAFISHVGLNSFVESSFAGVPILAIPLFTDQPHNAQSGKSVGTTFVLDKTKLTSENIVKGLEAVLFDSSFSLNAKRISKMLKDRPNSPKDQFLEWVEFAAKNPLLHKTLNLSSRTMGIFEYYCIDLIAFIFAFLVFSGFLVFQLFKIVFSGKGSGGEKGKVKIQ